LPRCPAESQSSRSRNPSGVITTRSSTTRRDVAIRDFFDVDHTTTSGRLNPADPTLLELLRHKLGVPDTLPVDVSAQRLAPLEQQLEGRLRPVLREDDYTRFDLERAIHTLQEVARELGRHR